MDNVIFQADTLESVGVNSPALPFQVSVNVPKGFNPSKVVQVEEGIRHKRNELGQKLFYDEENEVTYDTKAVAFEERKVTRSSILDNGEKVTETVTERVPIHFDQLKPVYVPFYKNSLVYLVENPTVFTYSEILQAKQEALAGQYGKELIYFNEEMAIESFSTNLSTFSADLGVGFAVLHGKGQLRTNKIPLPDKTQTIQVYAEVQEGIEVEVGFTASDFIEAVGDIQVPEGTKDVYIRFTNKAVGMREISAFGILA